MDDAGGEQGLPDLDQGRAASFAIGPLVGWELSFSLFILRDACLHAALAEHVEYSTYICMRVTSCHQQLEQWTPGSTPIVARQWVEAP